MLDSSELTMTELVSHLPRSRREMLALGPILDGDESETGCRVCDALLEIDLHNRAAALLLDHHEEEGRVGAGCYRRCCDIYRAAGWDG